MSTNEVIIVGTMVNGPNLPKRESRAEALTTLRFAQEDTGQDAETSTFGDASLPRDVSAYKKKASIGQ